MANEKKGLIDITTGAEVADANANGILNLSSIQVSQISNMGSTTISSDQWAFLNSIQTPAPTVNQALVFNGSQWVNGSTTTVSGSSGVDFYLDGTNIYPITAENSIEIYTLSKTPITTTETLDSIVATSGTSPVAGESYLYNSPLDITSIGGGVWSLDIWRNASILTGSNVLIMNVERVIPDSVYTITTTGAGTSRTAVVSGGTPFVAGDANADKTLSSYILTPKGKYQITAFTSSTEVTILVPAGYINETSVAYSLCKVLFSFNTGDINDLTLTAQVITNIQSSFPLNITDKIMFSFYATTTEPTVTVSYTHNGNDRYTHFTAPIITTHNQLPGGQGGNASEQYHLALAPYNYASTMDQSVSTSGSPLFANSITLKNSTFNGLLNTETLTSGRSWSLPNAAGTIALTSQIPSQYWQNNPLALSPVSSTNVYLDNLKNLSFYIPAAESFANYLSSVNLTYGGGVLTGAASIAYVSNGWLILGRDGGAFVTYNATGNFDSPQTGTVKCKYRPAYTDYPNNDSCIWSQGSAIGSNNNLITLYHTWRAPTPHVHLIMCDNSGSVIFDGSVGVWSPVAGTAYEFEFNYDLTTGATRLFIDGVQLGSTITATGTRGAITNFRVGAGVDNLITFSNGDVTDLVYYPTVQHTANYTPGYNLTFTQIGSDSSLVKNPTISGNLTMDGGTFYFGQTSASYMYVGSGSTASSIVIENPNAYLQTYNVLMKDPTSSFYGTLGSPNLTDINKSWALPNGSGVIQLNATTIAAPTVNNDRSNGYIEGYMWHDINSMESYVLYDATNAAAVWKKLAFASQIPVVPTLFPDVIDISSDGQTSVTLSHTPIGACLIFVNGLLQRQGAEYTRTGTSVTWLNAGGITLKNTDSFIAVYNY